jgi:hypothetical protein
MPTTKKGGKRWGLRLNFLSPKKLPPPWNSELEFRSKGDGFDMENPKVASNECWKKIKKSVEKKRKISLPYLVLLLIACASSRIIYCQLIFFKYGAS